MYPHPSLGKNAGIHFKTVNQWGWLGNIHKTILSKFGKCWSWVSGFLFIFESWKVFFFSNEVILKFDFENYSISRRIITLV